MDTPFMWRSFSLTPLQGHHFRLHGLHVRPFWREFSARQHVFLWTSLQIHFILQFSAFLLTMAEETANIYRVNKLLELEAADWQRQLEKAVGGFKVRSLVPFYFSLYGVSE